MTKWIDEFDDDNDLPQEIDLDDDDENGTVNCPACGRLIHEEAPRCPYCGEWVIDDLTPAEERSRGWFWPVMVALLVGLILVVWHGFGR